MSDGINGKALGEIAEHICWENEDVSRKIIKEVCNGINIVDFDRSIPFTAKDFFLLLFFFLGPFRLLWIYGLYFCAGLSLISKC